MLMRVSLGKSHGGKRQYSNEKRNAKRFHIESPSGRLGRCLLLYLTITVYVPSRRILRSHRILLKIRNFWLGGGIRTGASVSRSSTAHCNEQGVEENLFYVSGMLKQIGLLPGQEGQKVGGAGSTLIRSDLGPSSSHRKSADAVPGCRCRSFRQRNRRRSCAAARFATSAGNLRAARVEIS